MSQPYYDIGKATLTAGSDIMTGQGTLWIGNARPGDQVVSYSNHTAIVGEVVSNTQIKLKRPYRGTNQAAQVYEILYTPDDPYTQTIARGILHSISQSALVKLGSLSPAARQLVRFDQAGNAALSPLSDYMLTLLDDADAAAARTTLGAVSDEVGSWTPALAIGGNQAGLTYAIQSGRYQKIGRRVFASFSVVLTSKGTSSGDVRIYGLPFVVGGGISQYLSTVWYYNTVGTNAMFASAPPGATNTQLWGTSANERLIMSNSRMTDTSQFYGTIVYEAVA